MLEPCLSHDRKTLTVQIPMIFTTRGGRKLVVSPDGMPSWAEPKTRIDNTMVKALARAFSWRRLLEDGVYSGIEDLARAEKINTSYVSRILRLTLLAPDIVEMILDGRQSQSLTLKILQKSYPISWKEQSNIFL